MARRPGGQGELREFPAAGVAALQVSFDREALAVARMAAAVETAASGPRRAAQVSLIVPSHLPEGQAHRFEPVEQPGSDRGHRPPSSAATSAAGPRPSRPENTADATSPKSTAKKGALRRDVSHGCQGSLYQAYRTGQERLFGALGLVVNAITLLNSAIPTGPSPGSPTAAGAWPPGSHRTDQPHPPTISLHGRFTFQPARNPTSRRPPAPPPRNGPFRA